MATVVKVKSGGYSNINGATGSKGAFYEARDSDGETLATFRPKRVRGYHSIGAIAKDSKGQRIPVFKLSDFRAWAAIQ